MKLLIPYGFSSDLYLAWAAKGMGHELHIMYDDTKKCALLQRCFEPDAWARIKSHYETGLSNQEYSEWYHHQLYKYVETHGIDAILPSSSMDNVMMSEIAAVNASFGLPGINPKQAEVFRDKTIYMTLLRNHGVAAPRTYSIVEPGKEPTNYFLEYPCIAKPGLGSGGVGIYIAENDEQLRWFFSPSDKVEDFSEKALFYQDKDFAGKPKSYLHFGSGGRYIVQEYLEGPCISIAGTAASGMLRADIAYDIGITQPPMCSEISFGWPSNYDIRGAVQRCVASLGEALDFPDGAFMVDAIWKNGQLYVVDLSCRMSTSGTKMLYHACSDNVDYPMNVIEALLTGTPSLPITLGVPVYYSFIPFPKGKLQNIEYPKITPPVDEEAGIIERELPIKAGDKVFEMRNDLQVADRGWVVAVAPGSTREVAQKLVQTYINNIKYDILNINTQAEN